MTLSPWSTPIPQEKGKAKVMTKEHNGHQHPQHVRTTHRGSSLHASLRMRGARTKQVGDKKGGGKRDSKGKGKDKGKEDKRCYDGHIAAACPSNKRDGLNECDEQT